MQSQTVLISGASVAGPALAHWLHRYGFRPTIVERAPAPREGGQAVDLRGTAREIADRMGILPAVRAAHTGVRGMAFVDERGKSLATMSVELLGDSGGPIADLEILRGDLVRILHDALPDTVERIFDDSITGLRETSTGVDVTFERGAPRSFDLVIGADGLRSNVRGLAFGDDASWLHDFGCYASIFSVATPLELDGLHLMHSVPGTKTVGGKTVGLYPLPAPAGSAKAMFFFASPVLRYDRHDVPHQKALLRDAFVDVGWETPRLLAQLDDTKDFYFDRVCQVRMPQWTKGRVALLGDAAHCASPMAGNGTSMALVGAYVLAGELATAGADHAAAFARYEETMRAYVEGCQAFANEGRDGLLPKSRFHVWARNSAIRMLPYIPWRGVFFRDLQRIASMVKPESYPLPQAPRA